MQVELKRIQETVGITFVYVTHDQEEALSMSDRVAVMSNGHIEQLDDPRSIYDRPQTPFVAEFIGEMNFFTGQVTTVADGTFELDAGRGRRARARCRAAGGAGHRGRPLRADDRRGRGPEAGPELLAGRGAHQDVPGDQIQIVARLANGSDVVIREQRADADPAMDNVHPGEGITVSWDDSAPRILSGAKMPAARPKEEP